MAGSRKLPGGGTKPRRRDTRIAQHEHRVQTAPTGKAQLAAAYDRYRSAAHRWHDPATELHQTATWLNERAKHLERETA
jgi:hypothetical protein